MLSRVAHRAGKARNIDKETKMAKKKLVLPADPDGQNAERAEWAEMAIEQFENTTGTDREDALADLLCDLRHWADRNGLDWDAELNVAMGRYDEETTEVNRG